MTIRDFEDYVVCLKTMRVFRRNGNGFRELKQAKDRKEISYYLYKNGQRKLLSISQILQLKLPISMPKI